MYLHPRTIQDRNAIRPLAFAPLQRICSPDGDVVELRGRRPLEEVSPDDRPLVLISPDGMVEPPGPPAPPWEPGPKITALAWTVLALVLVVIGILAALALRRVFS